MRALAVAAMAFSAAVSLAAPDADFARLIHERLKTSPVLKGEFEQSKTLKGFRNPLVSKGEFLVARGQGVWWHTQQPFESTLVVTKTRLFTRNADGSAGNLMDAQAEPGLQQVNELIFSLLSADLDVLADKFTIVDTTGNVFHPTPLNAELNGIANVETRRGDFLEPACVLVGVHAIPSASSARTFSRPRRIRPFTVPSGTFSMPAISDWLKPPK